MTQCRCYQAVYPLHARLSSLAKPLLFLLNQKQDAKSKEDIIYLISDTNGLISQATSFITINSQDIDNGVSAYIDSFPPFVVPLIEQERLHLLLFVEQNFGLFSGGNRAMTSPA